MTSVYDYRIPKSLSGRLMAGGRVLVPFGPRRIGGFCVGLSDTTSVAESRLKDIISAGDAEEAVPADLLKTTRWIASYYHASWGNVLAAAVPSAVRKGRHARRETYVSLAVSLDEARAAFGIALKRSPQQQHALQTLLGLIGEAVGEEEHLVTAVSLQERAKVKRATLKALAARGLIRLDSRPVHRELVSFREVEHAIDLTPAQQQAYGALAAAVRGEAYSTFLLYGVTGSGKTEVYLRTMQDALQAGKSVLVLVPEISLTPQTVERFRERAGAVAVLHSSMSEGDRAQQWRDIRQGRVRVVVGARSAVFAPLADLGLVIVDEEHERTFKQETSPRYNARDVAVVRARENGAIAILGSATPSLESWQNARSGKYALLTLPERVGKAGTPSTVVVDMRSEWSDRKQAVVFSRQLERELVGCLHRKEQAILFLNRRGFNTSAQCRACGEVLRCASCDIALTYHQKSGVLRCHYCDYQVSKPVCCPLCSAATLHFSGTGTERVDDLLARLMPAARVKRMDSDTMTRVGAHAEALAAFARGEFDILLGTQMVTKGFDFPNVTLVGVLSADSAINMPDFRSAERCFQLVTQVVGRCGRSTKPGRAVVQAFQPDHYALQCALAQDFGAFARHELADRKAMGYPPFGRLLRIVGRGKKSALLSAAMVEIAGAMRALLRTGMVVLGPVPCPLARLHGEHRQHILLKASTHKQVEGMLRSVADALSRKNGIHISVDVDPVSLL